MIEQQQRMHADHPYLEARGTLTNNSDSSIQRVIEFSSESHELVFQDDM